MAIEDNTKGATAAFATFSPFKSFWDRIREHVVFTFASTANPAVRERDFLHYAYFANVTPKQLARAGIDPKGSLEHGALLFLSAYNGPAEIYFRGFSDKLHENMNSLWNGCIGWKTARDYRNLDAFIRSYRRNTTAFFNNYAEASKGLRRALGFRIKLDQLIAAAHGATNASEFANAYDRFVQVIWGNQ